MAAIFRAPLPHKTTFRGGVCRINALFRRGHAAWEHLDKEGMPHPVTYRRPQSAVRAGAARARCVAAGTGSATTAMLGRSAWTSGQPILLRQPGD